MTLPSKCLTTVITPHYEAHMPHPHRCGNDLQVLHLPLRWVTRQLRKQSSPSSEGWPKSNIDVVGHSTISSGFQHRRKELNTMIYHRSRHEGIWRNVQDDCLSNSSIRVLVIHKSSSKSNGVHIKRFSFSKETQSRDECSRFWYTAWALFDCVEEVLVGGWNLQEGCDALFSEGQIGWPP